MKIIPGAQTGVDRAALDAAIEAGVTYGGWCPRGGWAEDAPCPPGVLAHYPLLGETPLADPAQRTEWNVRDADATLILVATGGAAVSKGTALAQAAARRHGKSWLQVDLGEPDALERVVVWLRTQQDAHGPDLGLSVGGPRESEASGIYRTAKSFIAALLDQAQA
ncbi:putative molybdenum carrier protein [Microvirga massiliensis]|uniref:putative molybdenum carrier protein n=1 Tax=Microvirga massiliensis TaxID=1033741 RepID=UPI00062B2E95|nr:putative molybdenum carrier protein [Microvirga massiliensis]